MNAAMLLSIPVMISAMFDMPHNTAVVLRGVTILGLASGVVGTLLLLRKRSLTADALSHAALPGVALGFLLALAMGWPERSLGVLLPGAAVAALLGVGCIHALNALPRVREDAAIGVVLSVFFAVGMVLIGVIQNMPAGQKAGLHQFIFGQAATMRTSDANVIELSALLVLVITVALFKEWRLLCFDREFAASVGFPAWWLDLLLMTVVTVLTVIGLHAVGALLMVALLIIPAAAARFWVDRLTAMTVIAGAIGAIGAASGAYVSATVNDVPTGPAIILACGGLFLISLAAAPRRGLIGQLIQRWLLHRRVARQHLLRAMYECGELSGDFRVPVTTADLMERRRWSLARLTHLLARLRRRGEVKAADGGWMLTRDGRHKARRVVRTHRLWEHFLTTQADIAPSHVDRAADDIEHVLGEKFVAELETELRRRGVLPADAPVPPSPHELQEGGRTA